MTPEQQRITIAGACGWKMHTVAKDDPYTCTHCGIHYSPMIWKAWEIPYLWCNKNNETQPPDYLNDLNAMQQVHEVLTTAQMTTMSQYLHRKLGMLWGFSTASQRAEAFLRTIGKWEEAK